PPSILGFQPFQRNGCTVWKLKSQQPKTHSTNPRERKNYEQFMEHKTRISPPATHHHCCLFQHYFASRNPVESQRPCRSFAYPIPTSRSVLWCLDGGMVAMGVGYCRN